MFSLAMLLCLRWVACRLRQPALEGWPRVRARGAPPRAGVLMLGVFTMVHRCWAVGRLRQRAVLLALEGPPLRVARRPAPVFGSVCIHAGTPALGGAPAAAACRGSRRRPLAWRPAHCARSGRTAERPLSIAFHCVHEFAAHARLCCWHSLAPVDHRKLCDNRNHRRWPARRPQGGRLDWFWLRAGCVIAAPPTAL